MANPPPGTIVDHTFTRRNWWDFFLVSQHVNQGTVSPTHYIVVYDGGLKPDNLQKLTYKMAHMYYNWPGTIRVPAPCQVRYLLQYRSTFKKNTYCSFVFIFSVRSQTGLPRGSEYSQGRQRQIVRPSFLPVMLVQLCTTHRHFVLNGIKDQTRSSNCFISFVLPFEGLNLKLRVLLFLLIPLR